MSGRSTPLGHTNSARHSRNQSQLEHLKKVQIQGQAASRSSEHVFSSLRATQMVDSKPVLPAELIATILDYLPVSDLMRFARVSRRLQEMVYDDTRWIQKMKQMSAWNETEARQRVEEAMKRKTEAQLAKQTDDARRMGMNGTGVKRHAGSATLFDAGVEEQKYRTSLESQQSPQAKRRTITDGFEDLTLSGSPLSGSKPLPGAVDSNLALTAFKRVKSIRGHARQEFGKVYGALAPIYFDLARTRGHSDALIFRTYRDPEQQAHILSNLKRFAQCDLSVGWEEREGKLDGMIEVFENAVLREFDQGYAADDVPGRMHRYAHVLVTLNGGKSGIDLYMSNNPILNRKTQAGNPRDCLQDVAWGHVDLNPSQRFFEQLAGVMVQQADIIDTVFPQTVDVLTPFVTRLCEDVISGYLATLFDEAHAKGTETYVKAVAGTFGQAMQLAASLKATKAAPADFLDQAKRKLIACYEKHIDQYLSEEFAVFRLKAELDVTQWEKELSEQEASTESFFMSNVNRQAAKRDFLSSFKKVVMMPVNAFPISSPFASAKPATVVSKSSANLDSIETTYPGSRPRTPTLTTPPPRAATPQQEPPTTELAAKAAIMNSRLEGIKSLFSIDVALNLTHLAKASIERAATMVQMGGTYGEEANKQCERIFVTLLDILGNRHVKNGFDKAVGHLSNYNPREVRKFKQEAQGGEASESAHIGVEPLVTFLGLVNVGDLIQQMVDVFYSQELIATKLTDRDDFLDPAVKEKKKFEQMLDERVAAGLNKGIDVLMDEVEYICATTQKPTDFNPSSQQDDIGPSTTAKQVVDMVSGHTGMLVGSTDKTMLDVFNQEVGLRLFAALCKHFKRQRISVSGAIKLISDINHYSRFISSLRQKPLMPYFEALREMSQIYLVYIEPPASVFGNSSGAGKRGSFLTGKQSETSKQAKELAAIIADSQRYHGIFPTEEVYEFAERRADWYLVKGDVERAMYGVGCVVM